MERYTAYQQIIRVSHADEDVLKSVAQEIAVVTAGAWGTQGANITFGFGLWDGSLEHSAAIEIVTREQITNEQIMHLRNHVTALGLTAYVTVATVVAHELY